MVSGGYSRTRCKTAFARSAIASPVNPKCW
jgi:hypothetical protein